MLLFLSLNHVFILLDLHRFYCIILGILYFDNWTNFIISWKALLPFSKKNVMVWSILFLSGFQTLLTSFHSVKHTFFFSFFALFGLSNILNVPYPQKGAPWKQKFFDQRRNNITILCLITQSLGGIHLTKRLFWRNQDLQSKFTMKQKTLILYKQLIKKFQKQQGHNLDSESSLRWTKILSNEKNKTFDTLFYCYSW